MIGSITGLLFSPAGKYVMVILAFLSWTGYQRHEAAQAARDECNAVALEAENEALKTRMARLQRIGEEAQERLRATTERLTGLETQRDQLLEDIKNQGLNYTLPADFLERVRAIK